MPPLTVDKGRIKPIAARFPPGVPERRAAFHVVLVITAENEGADLALHPIQPNPRNRDAAARIVVLNHKEPSPSNHFHWRA